MTAEVEIFSATDPINVADRRVWYWLEFKGMRSERLNDYTSVLARAEAIMTEHAACLIDRSDKGSGYLLSTLGR